jgi:hypothetical protein
MGVRSTLFAAVLLAAVPRVPPPVLSGYPNSLAALGDSITRGYNTGVLPFTDAPGNGWSSGTHAAVGSHYLRILAHDAGIGDRVFNDARTGSRMADLLSQVRAANAQHVSYVTILIGANDVCAPSLDGMTSAAEFRAAFEKAMNRLSAGSPRARIYVSSIPDVYRLWSLFSGDVWARLAWRALRICPSLLARAGSTDPRDVARRAAVQQRTLALNAQLEAVCAEYIHCRFDELAVYDDAFTAADVSHRDYFHPSLGGQARLARVSWSATFDFADESPPSSTATVEPARGGSRIALTANDDVAVAGIEYRIDGARFRRYTRTMLVRAGRELRYRAVDVNGNIEATHALIG